MAFCDWIRMTWTSKNLTWKFNFDTCVPKLTITYNMTFCILSTVTPNILSD
jgi:hypothetical protein